MRCLSALSWPPKSDRYTKMPTSSDGALHNSNTGWCATCINYTPRTGWSGGGKEPSTPKCSPAVDEPFRVGFHQGKQHKRRGQINSYCIRSKWNAFRFCGSLLRLVSPLSKIFPLENPRSSGTGKQEEERERGYFSFDFHVHMSMNDDAPIEGRARRTKATHANSINQFVRVWNVCAGPFFFQEIISFFFFFRLAFFFVVISLNTRELIDVFFFCMYVLHL